MCLEARMHFQWAYVALSADSDNRRASLSCMFIIVIYVTLDHKTCHKGQFF